MAQTQIADIVVPAQFTEYQLCDAPGLRNDTELAFLVLIFLLCPVLVRLLSSGRTEQSRTICGYGSLKLQAHRTRFLGR